MNTFSAHCQVCRRLVSLVCIDGSNNRVCSTGPLVGTCAHLLRHRFKIFRAKTRTKREQRSNWTCIAGLLLLKMEEPQSPFLGEAEICTSAGHAVKCDTRYDCQDSFVVNLSSSFLTKNMPTTGKAAHSTKEDVASKYTHAIQIYIHIQLLPL